MLVIDANVLLRSILGRASPLILGVAARGHRMLTTEHTVNECLVVLGRKLGMEAGQAILAVADATRPLEVLGPIEYAGRRADAALRLRKGGQSDWPALAAALALGADIWSDDVDFFGVGVPVWSSMTARKVLLGQAGGALEQV